MCGAGALGEGKMLQGSVDSSGPRFNPLVVVELASDTKEEAIAWLLSRIRDPQQNGGVDVKSRSTQPPHCVLFHFVFLILHFSQVLSSWWSSWGLELEIRRRKTPTCSWWVLHISGCSLVQKRWGSSRSITMDP